MNQTDLSLYRVPPQAIDIEESILATCLVYPDSSDEIVESLKPLDFYKTSHQIIFSSISKLSNSRQKTDLPSVCADLRESERLDECGGAGGIAEITEIPVSTNIAEFIKTIKVKAVLRSLIDTTSRISNECFSGVDDIDEFLNRVHSEIMAIDSDTVNQNHITIQDLSDERLDHYEEISSGGKTTGVKSGYYDLDELTYGFQDSDLIILAARPSMGKTALMLNMAKNQAENGVPVAIFSLEQSNDQIGDRSFALTSGVNGIKFRSGKFQTEDWPHIADAAEKMRRDWKLVIEDSPNLHYMDIWRRARRFKREYGIKIVYIDYLGFIRGDHPDNPVKNVESVTRGLKAMAKDLRIPVVLIAQLNRNLEHRNDKHPILADLRDSGAIEQDADLVLFIYRDEVYNDDEMNPNKGKAEIMLSKQRNGPKGNVRLLFFEKQMRFDNPVGEY